VVPNIERGAVGDGVLDSRLFGPERRHRSGSRFQKVIQAHLLRDSDFHPRAF
jgi:hypothetical protein